MEKLDFPKIPKDLLELAKKSHGKYYMSGHLINHEEVKDGKVIIYTWWSDGKQQIPETITVMTKKSWKTWDGKKWGKKKLNPGNSYCTIFDDQLDKKTFGKTILELQDEDRWKRRKREEDRREAKIHKITSRMKDIPKKILKWARFNMKHYILFESGKREGFCTNCAAQVKFEHDRPKNRRYIRCPNCGNFIEARTYKTVPSESRRSFMYFQECDGGFLLRIFHMVRENPSDPEFTDNIREDVFEMLCCGVVDGEQIWIEKREFFSYWIPRQEDRERWYLNRTHGATRRYLSPYYDMNSYKGTLLYKKDKREFEYLVPKTYGRKEEWERITDSKLHYIIEYYDEKDKDGMDFLRDEETFREVPQIEGLYKNGFQKLADVLMNTGARWYQSYIDKTQSELHKFLKIKKETFRELRAMNNPETVTWEFIGALKTLEKTDVRVEDYIDLCGLFHSQKFIWTRNNIAEKLHVRFTKINNYLNSQFEENENYSSPDVLDEVYEDYIEMAERQGTDLSDPFVIFPRDIDEAHNSLTIIEDEIKERQRAKRIAEQNGRLFKAVEKIAEKFTMEKDDLIIRPALSATEIVKEGQSQHNCVGRAGYIEKMIEGKCVILFLRKKETPDQSYYTVETDRKGNVRQAYAANNKKTDDYETVIEPFLKELRKKVQRGKKCTAAG